MCPKRAQADGGGGGAARCPDTTAFTATRAFSPDSERGHATLLRHRTSRHPDGGGLVKGCRPRAKDRQLDPCDDRRLPGASGR